VAKFAVFDAGVQSSEWVVVGVAAFVSLLTLYSMTKIWAGAFWGDADDRPRQRPDTSDSLGGPTVMLISTAAVVVIGVAVMVFARPLYSLSERAAQDLLEPIRYVSAVLGGRP
jgi:multicomponent Na+:H+ antiporter subunit D